jgi:flagellar hook-associated protein 3 FlgL
MRITFAHRYDKSIRDINAKRESLDRLTTMTSSGKRLINPSDDPLAWSQSMGVKNGLREIESYSGNIQFSLGWNRATEDALNAMSDVMLRARDAATAFVSATSDGERQALVQTLDQAIEEAVGLANTRYGDQYLFGGKGSASAPFDSQDLTQYHGSADILEVRTGSQQRQVVNIDGRSAFYTDSPAPGSSMLQALVDVRDAVGNGQSATVQSQLAVLDAGYEHLTSMGTLVGTRIEKLEHHEATLSSLKLQEAGRLSELEDSDLAEVLSRLQQQRTAFEAALKVTSTMNDLNLAKYL